MLMAPVAAATARHAVHVARCWRRWNTERGQGWRLSPYTDASGSRTTDRSVRASPPPVKTAVLATYLGVTDATYRPRNGQLERRQGTFYADTFGSSITQQRVRLPPCPDAAAADPKWRAITDADVGSADRPGLGSGGWRDLEPD